MPMEIAWSVAWKVPVKTTPRTRIVPTLMTCRLAATTMAVGAVLTLTPATRHPAVATMAVGVLLATPAMRRI